MQSRSEPGVNAGIGAVVIRDDRLLMLHRSRHGVGWTVPGGWVELGEHPWEAAEREVMEETGVIVRATQTGSWTSVQGDDIHSITLWVFCDWVEGEPENLEPEKHHEVCWVPLDDIEDGRLLYGGLKTALETIGELGSDPGPEERREEGRDRSTEDGPGDRSTEGPEASPVRFDSSRAAMAIGRALR